jgi:hypothetical protein
MTILRGKVGTLKQNRTSKDRGRFPEFSIVSQPKYATECLIPPGGRPLAILQKGVLHARCQRWLPSSWNSIDAGGGLPCYRPRATRPGSGVPESKPPRRKRGGACPCSIVNMVQYPFPGKNLNHWGRKCLRRTFQKQVVNSRGQPLGSRRLRLPTTVVRAEASIKPGSFR